MMTRRRRHPLIPLPRHPVVRFFLWIAALWFAARFIEDIMRAVGTWFGRIGLFLFLVALTVLVLWIAARKAQPLVRLTASLFRSVGVAIGTNPDIRKFIDRYPGFFTFLGRRFERGNFFGLPLSLLALALAYTLFLFFGVLDSILDLDQTVMFDTRIANLLYTMRDPDLVRVFLWITLLANWKVVVSLAVTASVAFHLLGHRVFIIPLWITLAGSKLFEWGGKLLVERPRPDTAYYYEPSFSFPSGHAALSMALYGFLAYALFALYRRRRTRVAILFPVFTVVFAVGLSRLYLGVHYWSDVWGGYLVGALWLIIGVSLTEWLVRKKTFPDAPTRDARARRRIAVLLVMETILYVALGLRYDPTPIMPGDRTTDLTVPDVQSVTISKQFPRYTETPDGNQQEPIGIVVVAQDDARFVAAMERSGWHLADPVTFTSLTQFGFSVILGQSYPTAPITPSFWNAHAHALGFEQETGAGSVRERHHARFWHTPFVLADGSRIYAGTASLDNGIKWGGLTHTIDPDIDTERKHLVDTLTRGDHVQVGSLPFVRPQLGRNFTGDYFFTQGDLRVIRIGNIP